MWTSGLPVPHPGSSGFFSLLLTGSLLPSLVPLPTTKQTRHSFVTVPGLGLQPLCSYAPRSPHTSEPPTQGSPRRLSTRISPAAAARGRPYLDLLHPPGQAADPGAQILLLQAPRVGQDFRHERSHCHEEYPHQQDTSLQQPAPQLGSRQRPRRTACRETEFYVAWYSRTGKSHTTVPSRPRAVRRPQFRQRLGGTKMRRRDPLPTSFQMPVCSRQFFSFCILVWFSLIYARS